MMSGQYDYSLEKRAVATNNFFPVVDGASSENSQSNEKISSWEKQGPNGLPILSKSNFPGTIDVHALRNLRRADRGLDERISDSDANSPEKRKAHDEDCAKSA